MMSGGAGCYSPSYAVDDYEQREGDWELWNGVAVCMSPSPSPLHQFVATSLAAEIREQLHRNNGCHCVVVAKTDWRIDPATVVRPDVSFLCHGIPAKYIDYPPALVAEVIPPATEHKDRAVKRALYQQQGVRWYLVIDAESKTVEFLELDSGQYMERPASAATASSIALPLSNDCTIELVVERVFHH